MSLQNTCACVYTWIPSLPACRCFGLLISPGKDVKNSEMNLLDNMVGFHINAHCMHVNVLAYMYNVHVHFAYMCTIIDHNR